MCKNVRLHIKNKKIKKNWLICLKTSSMMKCDKNVFRKNKKTRGDIIKAEKSGESIKKQSERQWKKKKED